MSTYTFKRGVIRSPETWTVSDSKLSQDNGKVIDLARVVAGKFADAPAGRLMVTELILETDDGKHQLQCNDRRGGVERQQFLALCREVTDALASAAPAVRFTQTIGMQLLGWMFAAFGVAVVVFGTYHVVNSAMALDRVGAGFGLGMGIVATLFGVFLVWCGSPWDNPQPKTPTETREWIERIQAMG